MSNRIIWPPLITILSSLIIAAITGGWTASRQSAVTEADHQARITNLERQMERFDQKIDKVGDKIDYIIEKLPKK